MNKNTKDNKDKIKTTHEVSGKLAETVGPWGLATGVKNVSEIHEKVTGKKNWFTKHSIDIAIFIGFVWGIGKVLYFYFPDSPWTAWVNVLDAFIPITATVLAIIYRLYPHINLFFSKNR